MHIREIRNPLYFQDFCQQLLVAEYDNVKIVDDSRGDRGIDAYVPSIETLFAVYCPGKDSTKKTTIQAKIREDVEKAARLPELGYSIKNFVFVTPAPLEEELHRYLADYAVNLGFESGCNKSEKYLISLMVKYPELRKCFPALIMPDLEKQIGELGRTVIAEITEELRDLPSKIALQFAFEVQPDDTGANLDLTHCLKKYRENLQRRISETRLFPLTIPEMIFTKISIRFSFFQPLLKRLKSCRE